MRAKNLDVTEQVIRSATAGMKDEDSSFISVMSNIFSPLSRKRVKELGLNDMEENRYVGRLSADIDACGSADRVAVGTVES